MLPDDSHGPKSKRFLEGQTTFAEILNRAVLFVIKGGQVVLQPLTKTLFDLRGIVPVDEPQDFEAIRHAVRQQQTDQVARTENDDES